MSRAQVLIMKRSRWLLVLIVIIAVTALINLRNQTTSSSPPAINIPTRVVPTLSLSRQTISAETIGRVTQLVRRGEGIFGSLAQSRDGDWLAVATSLGIRLYDAQTLDPVRFIEMPEWVMDLAFSPDSKTLASAQGNTVKLWRVADGSLLRTLEGHQDIVRRVSFAPDGATLVSASRDDTIRVWRVADGTVQQVIDPQAYVFTLEISPDGTLIALGGAPNSQDSRGQVVIQLRQVNDGRLVREIETDLPPIDRIVFSPDGKRLATAANFVAFGDVAVWQSDGVFAYKLARPRPDTMLAVTDVAFSADGQVLISAWADGLIRLYRANDGTYLRNIGEETSPANGLLVAPDGQTVTASYSDGALRQWRFNTGQATKSIALLAELADDLRFSPTGNELALVTGNLIEMRRVSDDALLRTLKGHTQSIYSLTYSPDGKNLATASRDQTVKIWNVTNGVLLQTLPGQGQCLSFSPDSAWLAGIGEQGQAWLWNNQAGTKVTRLGQPGTQERAATCTVFLPDSTLAVGLSTGLVQIWQPRDGTLARTLGENHPYLYHLAVSPDGKYLALQSADQNSVDSVQVVQLSDGTIRQISSGKCSSCLVRFSPDSRLLIGSQDQDILLRQVADGKALSPLKGHTAQILAVAISPDGTLLASTSSDGTIRLWGTH